MIYEKSSELYARLQSTPIERLKNDIDSMFAERNLEEIIDKESLNLLASMPDERREQIQQLYPGLIQKIPFKMALQRRTVKRMISPFIVGSSTLSPMPAKKIGERSR